MSEAGDNPTLPEANESPPFEFDVEPTVPARLVDYYLHPYKHYLAVYGYQSADAKTIKRLVKKGKEAQPKADLPPLDSPADMPAWWRRNFPNAKVPDGIRRAASAAREVSTPVEAAPAADSGAPGAAHREAGDARSGNAVPADAAGGNAVSDDRGPRSGGMDFPAHVAALSRIAEDLLRQFEHVSGERMPATLVDETDKATWVRAKADRVEAAQKSYRDALETLRKAEANLSEWKKAREEWVDRGETKAEVMRVVSAMNSAVKRLLIRARPKLAGKTDAEQDKIYDEERREVFRVLTTSDLFADLFAAVA